MRISKLSDSPLNESQFSDVQQNPKILDTNFQVVDQQIVYYHYALNALKSMLLAIDLMALMGSLIP